MTCALALVEWILYITVAKDDMRCTVLVNIPGESRHRVPHTMDAAWLVLFAGGTQYSTEAIRRYVPAGEYRGNGVWCGTVPRLWYRHLPAFRNYTVRCHSAVPAERCWLSAVPWNTMVEFLGMMFLAIEYVLPYPV